MFFLPLNTNSSFFTALPRDRKTHTSHHNRQTNFFLAYLSSQILHYLLSSRQHSPHNTLPYLASPLALDSFWVMYPLGLSYPFNSRVSIDREPARLSESTPKPLPFLAVHHGESR